MIVVAHQVNNVSFAEGPDAFIRLRVITRHIPKRDDPFASELFDLRQHRLKSRIIAVDVSEDR